MKKKVVVKFAVAAYDRGTGLFKDNLVAGRFVKISYQVYPFEYIALYPV